MTNKEHPMQQVDPVTVEVIRNAFISIASQMYNNLDGRPTPRSSTR